MRACCSVGVRCHPGRLPGAGPRLQGGLPEQQPKILAASSQLERQWVLSLASRVHTVLQTNVSLLLLVQVACETCSKTNMVMVFGEITTKAKVDYEAIVRRTCREIGFTSDDVGLDGDKCKVGSSACGRHVPSSVSAERAHLSAGTLPW